MFDVKNFGTLSSSVQYEKTVSVSYDTLEYDSNAEVKVLVQIEPPSIMDSTGPIIDNHQNFDLILTWNEDLLHLPNAQKFIFGCCWIEWDSFKENKQKVPSIL